MTEAILSGLYLCNIVLISLLGILIWMHELSSFKKNIFLLFLGGLLGYTLMGWEPTHEFPWLTEISFTASVGFLWFFWMLSKALFDDQFQWSKKWTYLSIAAFLGFNISYRINAALSDELYHRLGFIPYFLSIILIIMVSVEALKNKENDLVSLRRKNRNLFIIVSVSSAFLTVFYFFTDNPLKLPVWFQFTQNLTNLLLISIFLILQTKFQPIFKVPHTKSSSNKQEEELDPIINLVTEAFTNKELYKREGLTISELAQEIDQKEYMVRKAINGKLGYTNFNAFLNDYRIQEACRIISSPDFKLTFQELSFAIGYQSIATFNRAFKSVTGKTPSQYLEGSK